MDSGVDYAPGMRVLIRGEEWRVKKVEDNILGNKALYCVGISDLVRDREAVFLSDLDHIEPVNPENIHFVIDDSGHYRKSRLYIESQLRQKVITDKAIHIGDQAVMDPMPYQLEPAEMALGRLRQRILIADSVGLGKTLEAGVLMSELIARGKGKRILVVTVKSMMTQFQKEMWDRFTIPLVRLDSSRIARIRASLPSNYNPFFYYDKVIVSIDTLKRDVEYRVHLENAYWDIIVIDEAQNVADRKNQAQRSKLAKLLARRSDSLILLSATPHDGRPSSFASLMNMLDPTAIANPEKYTTKDIQGLFIRRFKKDVKDQMAGAFLERKVSIEKAAASPAEEAAFDELDRMKLDMDESRKNQTAQGAGYLLKTGFLKSLFSSPAACLKSLDERLKKLYKRYPQGGMGDIAKLEQLKSYVERIGNQDFSKYRHLLSLLKSREYGWNPKAKDDRIVIFTERIETMKYVAAKLREDLDMTDEEEIRKYAFALLKGINFDDLDDSTDVGDTCRSLMHGEKPVIKKCRTANQELDFITSTIEDLQKSGVKLRNICLVARTNSLVDNYKDALQEKGIPIIKITKDSSDSDEKDGIRIATMHRVKGLEFEYVFVAGANNNVIPLKNAIDETDEVSREESLISEKCLLYVALTRARRGAFISSFGKASPFLGKSTK